MTDLSRLREKLAGAQAWHDDTPGSGPDTPLGVWMGLSDELLAVAEAAKDLNTMRVAEENPGARDPAMLHLATVAQGEVLELALQRLEVRLAQEDA